MTVFSTKACKLYLWCKSTQSLKSWWEKKKEKKKEQW